MTWKELFEQRPPLLLFGRPWTFQKYGHVSPCGRYRLTFTMMVTGEVEDIFLSYQPTEATDGTAPTDTDKSCAGRLLRRTAARDMPPEKCFESLLQEAFCLCTRQEKAYEEMGRSLARRSKTLGALVEPADTPHTDR